MLLAVLALAVMSLAGPAHRGDASDGLWQPLRHMLSDNLSRQVHATVDRQGTPDALPPQTRINAPRPSWARGAWPVPDQPVAEATTPIKGKPRAPPVM